MKSIIQFFFLTSIFLLVFVSCNGFQQEVNPVDRIYTIKNLNQLATLEADIVKILSASDEATWFKLGNRKILFSCEGKIKAGIDLNKLQKENIRVDVQSKMVELSLPPAEVFLLKINPGAIREVYSEIGITRSDFSTAEKEDIFKMGQKKIEQSIPELGILKQAEQNATLFLTAYLRTAGFKNIQINYTAK